MSVKWSTPTCCHPHQESGTAWGHCGGAEGVKGYSLCVLHPVLTRRMKPYEGSVYEKWSKCHRTTDMKARTHLNGLFLVQMSLCLSSKTMFKHVHAIKTMPLMVTGVLIKHFVFVSFINPNYLLLFKTDFRLSIAQDRQKDRTPFFFLPRQIRRATTSAHSFWERS